MMEKVFSHNDEDSDNISCGGRKQYVKNCIFKTKKPYTF